MASRGRRGGASAREDEPRRDDQAEQQASAPRGPTQAHTQATLQAQLEAQERADVWWSSLLRTRFEDGAVDVTWDAFVRLFRAKFVPEHIQDKMEQEFLSLTQASMTILEYEARFSELSKYAPHIVEDERRKTKKFVMGLKPSLRTRLVAFDHRTLDEALSAACRQEGEMEQYLKEKKASQKRPATSFQQQDKKKTVLLAEGHLGVNLRPLRWCQRPDMDANTNPGVQRYGCQSLWPACAAELQTSETRKPAIGGLSPMALRAVKSL
ncbi:hypothetical protein Taro_037110 [Colocasia esculenta]|uniref:Retrotransposon gag domain-containing protein n=1 Tax=Colocasia esculenta TaxID=4460 RepID=A0A843VZI6_COLES|nr:hypothetical protein [Colocasia esculenta]